MKNRRTLALCRVLSVSVGLALIVALGGCGSPANRAATVHFLGMDYDPVSSALQQRIVDSYNAEHPDERVNLEIVHWNDGHQKIQTLLSGNQAPDLAIVGTRWMAEYAKAGLLEDLGAMDDHGIRRADFIPGVLRAGSIDGVQVGLPVAASVRGLYYNAAMLKKAGVQPPKTWADLLAIAPKIQAAQPGVSAIGIHGKEVETDLYFYYFLWGAGGDILDANGKCALDSPLAVEALDFELDLIEKGYSEPQPTGYNRENLQDLFKAGKIAMVITGPWFAGMLKKEKPDLEFGVTYVPGKSGPVVPAVTDNIVMFKSSRHKAAAWEFLADWYRDENRVEWARASGMLPEKRTVSASPALAGDAERAFFIKALPGGRYVPVHPAWEQIANVVSESVQSAMLGQSSAEVALHRACAEVDRLIAESR